MLSEDLDRGLQSESARDRRQRSFPAGADGSKAFWEGHRTARNPAVRIVRSFVFPGGVVSLVFSWIRSTKLPDTLTSFVGGYLVVTTCNTDNLPLRPVLSIGYPPAILVVSPAGADVANIRAMTGGIIVLSAGVARLKGILAKARHVPPLSPISLEASAAQQAEWPTSWGIPAGSVIAQVVMQSG